MFPKKRQYQERGIQISLFNWARYKIIPEGVLFDFMTASANGGSRNKLEAKYLKLSGVSAGFPDISILIPRYGYHGMFLEVKRDENYRITDLQKKWLERLKKNGYHAVVGNGLILCKRLIEEYLK